MGSISGEQIDTWWYNPRDGKCYTAENVETDQPFAEYASDGDQVNEFDPPGNKGITNDWILVLDNVNAGYLKP